MKTLYIATEDKLYRYDSKSNLMSFVLFLESFNTITSIEEWLLKERGLKPCDYKLQVL